MDTATVKEYFDNSASSWDEEMIRNDEIINLILDNAGVSEGKDVLDVACGTGVLFPDYLDRNVASITGVDISPEMLKIAGRKFTDGRISLVCDDIEEITILKDFDCIVIYNAFPHFMNPERVIANLAQMLKQNGTLTVAHGMSRHKLDEHHSGSAEHVSNKLIGEDELAAIFERYLKVAVKISDDRMYQVTGIKI